MQEAFDPYSAWLAIPLSQRPVNHYDLLGIFRFESNPQSIEQAFERQMERVTCHLQGPLAHYATQLLGELTLAKYCLLDPQQREAYNAQLSQPQAANLPPHATPPEPPPTQAPPAETPLAQTQPVAPPHYSPPSHDSSPHDLAEPLNAAVAQTPPNADSRAKPKAQQSQNPRGKQRGGIELIKIIAGGVGGVLIALFIINYLLPGNSGETGADAPQQPANDSSPHDSRQSDTTALPAHQPDSSAQAAVPSPTAGQPTSGTARAEPDMPQAEAIPAQELVSAARASLLGKLESSSAQDLLQASGSNSDASQDYVLLRAAADRAAANGEYETAFTSLEVLAQQFQIDRLAYESELLTTFAQSSASELPLVALTQRALTLTERASEADRTALALHSAQLALLFARESGSPTLIRAATLLVLDCQALAPAMPLALAPANQSKPWPAHRTSTDSRWPLPTASEREVAQELIYEIYADDFATAESPAQRIILARKLASEAFGTYDNPRARYELTLESLAIYIELGKLPPAIEVIEQLNRTHAIEVHAFQAETVAAMLPNLETAGELRLQQEQLSSLIQAAAHAEQYDAAYALLDATFQAAAIFEQEELLDQLDILRNNLETTNSQWKAAEHARARLQTNPIDRESNFVLGRYLCLTRGNWEKGIPYLALGSNAEMRQAAQLELTIGAASVQLKQVGDAWWECQFSQSETGLTATRQRAAFWYSVAAVELTGISKTTAEQRAEQVGSLRDTYPLAGSPFMARSPALRPIASRGVGANTASELAVEQGLVWLANHQIFDGSWDFTFHGPICEGRCEDTGSFYAPYASTGLALLPLLAAGSTHQYGPYQENVAAGLDYLLENMHVNMNQVSWLDNRGMYSHAVCTLALAEVYLMTHDPQLKSTLESAIRFLCQAQDTQSGGWNIVPDNPNDYSITGWALMALKTAHLAGLNTPNDTVIALRNLVEPEIEVENEQEDDEAETPADDQPAPPLDPRDAATLQFCRMHLDWNRDNPLMIEGYAVLAETPPDSSSLYYDFFAMQVMRLYRDDHWSRWHVEVRDQLVAAQEKSGHAAGSWHFPQDQGGVRSTPLLYGDIGADDGGRLYSTVMSLLILQTYHRQSGLNL